jgi:hypothetical protein
MIIVPGVLYDPQSTFSVLAAEGGATPVSGIEFPGPSSNFPTTAPVDGRHTYRQVVRYWPRFIWVFDWVNATFNRKTAVTDWLPFNGGLAKYPMNGSCRAVFASEVPDSEACAVPMVVFIVRRVAAPVALQLGVAEDCGPVGKVPAAVLEALCK